MSEFFKSKRKLAVMLGALFLAITIAAGSMAHLLGEDAVEAASAGQEAAEETGDTPEPLSGPTDGEEPQGAAYFNMPGEMRGVFLVPGSDFLTAEDADEKAVRAEIDAALQNALDLTMNTVIVDTAYGDGVIFAADEGQQPVGFDAMQYLVEQCREKDLYIYAIIDASRFTDQQSAVASLSIGGAMGGFDRLSANLKAFAENYNVDGILLDGYTSDQESVSYSLYRAVGSSIGYANYLRQTPKAMVETAAKTIRKFSPGIQVGLLADGVWANSGEEEGGSATKAEYTALSSGNADTKAFVEEGLVDFVAVKAYGSLTDEAEPFGEVVGWWAQVASENDVRMYVVHASEKAGSGEPGWQAAGQLAAQVASASELPSVGGSIFNNLHRMVEDPGQSTTKLLGFYKDEEVEPEKILAELEMTKPAQTTYTTFEPSVTFTGASDPEEKVTLNGEEIKTDNTGYFTITKELKAGSNQFVVEHKDKAITYTITRKIQVLKEISPTGSISTEGSMSVAISAVAYQDASVYATINGATVPMAIDESAGSEENRDSSYATFVGAYTVPAASSSIQSLGNIVVYATWQGESESLQGASVKVNKRPQLEDGVPVVVVAEQAKTYPSTTLDNIPDNSCFPLPKGAMDYAVGEELTFKKDGKTYTYQVLASGLRVESKDIQASSDYAGGNSISGLEVESRDGCTYVTLKTAQKVSYNLKCSGDAIRIGFNNTVSVPGDLALSKNPIFSSANWSDTTLVLPLKGGFMGYKGYYDGNGNLVFRFNNPPGSLAGARIAVDSGHGGSDPGALGFLADYPESVINRAIQRELAAELESRGATVLTLDTSGGMELDARVARAEDFGADLFVSIHNNTAQNSSAAGTEVYYHYDFSKTLASSISGKVSSQMNTNNRGGKQSYYRVTLSSQFQSVLVECGFLSNKDEYEKLIKDKYQARIAVGIADGLEAAVASAYPGSGSSGVESVGGVIDAAGAEEESRTETGAETKTETETETETETDTGVTEITLNRDEAELAVGDTLNLTALSDKGEAASVTWESDDTDVASVDANGVVTAKGEGAALITAYTSSGVYAECVIWVDG